MATDQSTPAQGDNPTGGAGQFGHVSRRVGVAFRYLLLASTLAGIVALFLLLLYVANDALQPLTADPGWHLTYFLTLVAPATAVGAYLAKENRAGLQFGLTVLATAVLATMVTGGAAALLVDVVSPVTILAYGLAVAVPAVGIVALQHSAHRIGFVPRLVGAVAVTVAALALVPTIVYSVPVLPADWTIVALTFGVPVALVVGRAFSTDLWRSRDAGRDSPPSALGGRTSLVAGGVVLLGAFAAGPAGLVAGIGAVPAVLVWLGLVVPVAAYVSRVSVTRPSRRAGLGLPAVVVAGALAGTVLVDRLGFAGPQTWLDWQFLVRAHSNTAAQAGVYPAIVGTIMLMIIVTLVSFPLGVGAAIYLEEYAPDTTFTRIVDVNISNLAGVPSVVYGLLGLGAFVRFGGFSAGTVIVGGLTLSLLILPIVIISSREAIRAVPDSLREASYGMGATRWQTVRDVVLPRAFPGILTGTILALGRAIGETAPLLMIGAPAVFDLPTSLDDPVGALPLQIYAWASTFADEAFYTTALAAGVVTLLVVMLTMNSLAIVLRNRFEREQH